MQPDLRSKLLKKAAIYLSILTVCLFGISYLIPVASLTLARQKEAFIREKNREQEKLLAMSGTELIDYANETVQGITVTERKVDFDLPLGCKGENVKIEADMRSKTVKVSLPYADENYFLDRTVTGDVSILSDASYEYADRVGTVTLVTDKMYECITDYNDETFSVTFKTPKEFYDKVILIDAASGGSDSGVEKYNIDGKNINLDICLKLKNALDELSGVGVYYTRLSDDTVDDATRIEYASDIEADLVVSVQMNHTPSGKISTINGTQVLYMDGDEAALELATNIKDALVDTLDTSDKGVKTLTEDDVWVDCTSPVVVVKPGFMTNTKDLELLSMEESRAEVADILYEQILNYLYPENEEVGE